MSDIQGRVAFVTGGASGLGLSMARIFLKRGASVMLADRDAEGLERAVAELSSDTNQVASVVCDVADASEIEKAAQATIDHFGKVHIVVNNAGVGLGGQPGEIPLQDWRWIVDINLMGVVHGVEVFAPLIQSHGEGGHIINTGSMAGHVAPGGMGPYNATKYAVVGYSESLKAELMPHNIGVSVLCPGWVRTNIHTTGFGRPSGGPTLEEAKDDPQFQEMDAVIKGGLDPDKVAEWVADCVEANRLYIFTHEIMKIGIDMKYAQIQADYDAIIQDGRFKD
ncbi:MAG: SDR family NAD(P)-dependent oxidoreductase [Hyphomonadaceae bacterium]|nr:SDR family NAD(P)-dependent oxidoreductase [Hyphomonadaceae bacterium]